MKNNRTLTRRSFAALGTVAALGLVAEAKAERALTHADIVYKPADPSKVADYAYELYSEGSCMYAAVKSVLSMTIAKPVPIYYDMFRYGHGGCGGQGSLCGACNGIAAAIGFYIADKKECAAMIAEVFRWYETTNLPMHKPAGFDKDTATSASGSTLCHISMTKWSKAAGKSPFSSERKTRCARLTADTAAKTVELLNEYFSGSQKSVKQTYAKKQPSCAPCHMKDIKSGKLSKSPKVKVKMDCTPCHTDPHPDKK
jgi:hypothetical protein